MIGNIEGDDLEHMKDIKEVKIGIIFIDTKTEMAITGDLIIYKDGSTRMANSGKPCFIDVGLCRKKALIHPEIFIFDSLNN